ncbi:MAG TPA: beta-ketoacyl synthase N-terminal-like domain-containing protein [Kofleriaceae bacterium]|nr:beta-ketoacyl synthase N-terminal-like domain-containing protein [Kofleriaceae bacterium]
MKRRVYVHAVGACTPMSPDGASWRDSVPALLRGASAIRSVDHFDTNLYPSHVAAWIGRDGLDAHGDRRLPLLTRALAEIAAAVELQAYGGARCGVFLGAESGRASPQAILRLTQAAAPDGRFDHAQFVAMAEGAAGAVAARSVSPAAVAATLAAQLDAQGPVQTISLACASGASAIIAAVRQLRLGLCDTALAGGVGADVDPFMLVGFGKLGALSARGVSRPFDRARDGFVVGEGAALVLLSTTPPPAGMPCIEIVGVGASLDGYHLTAPHPEGDGAERAIRAALRDADCDTVDYVQAHGTSTPLNDATECQAIARVFANGAAPAVSSVKGAVGHWIAGAGAVGFLCAVEALQGNVIPTAGLTDPDAACAADHVMVDSGGVRTAIRPVRRALVNAFAFGGANAALIVEVHA